VRRDLDDDATPAYPRPLFALTTDFP
jgi:hypothetical protein